MKLLLYVFSCYVIWFSPAVLGSPGEIEALVFDRFFEMPVKMPRKVPKDAECGAWAVACPAETTEEEKFVKRYSFTNNALFVRATYSKGAVKAFEVKNKICKKPPKISLVYSVNNYDFQFGYEIYYDPSDAQFYHLDVYKDYKTPEKVIRHLKNRFKRGIFQMKEYYRIIKNGLGIDVKELWLGEDKRLGFTWVYLFKLTFDLSKKILKVVWYVIEDNSRWALGVQCEKYTLGHETYEDINVDNLYSYQNEAKIFQNFMINTQHPSVCLPQSGCLRRWLLIPIDQFRFGSSAPPVCSNMATIPIWRKNVEPVLAKVDAYLYSLYRVIKEPFLVISGIHGELKLQPKNKILGTSTPYLDPLRQKIPIPQIIYKIIEYRSKDCLLSDDKCTYSVIIVIHNDPFFHIGDKICTETDQTENWGWESIKQDIHGNNSENIYVCVNEINLLRKLSVVQRYALAGGLSLHNFPFTGHYREEFKGNDIKYHVDQKFKDLYENGDDPDLYDGDILQRVQIPSNFEDPEVRDAIAEDSKRAGEAEANKNGPNSL